MPLPNYQNNSIVNLMSSILYGLGADSPYAPLDRLPPPELGGSQNIVLLVIDGLGYDYLTGTSRQDTILHEHLAGKLTSVFPSTTAAAITAISTGLAPQQHGITGWFMYLKEMGTVSAILPFTPRYGGDSFTRHKIDRKKIFDRPRLADRIQADAYIVMPHSLVASDTLGRAIQIPHQNFGDCLRLVQAVISLDERQKYIYAYWPGFDSISHKKGNGSRQTADHFYALAQKIHLFVKAIQGTDTTLIVTADHGFIDAPESRWLWLKDHPRLEETLTLPLCGEPRAAYCYVRPERVAQFEAYVREELAYCCDLHRSEQAIADNYFGLFEPHPRLADRVGDYILVMKENYVLKETIWGESENRHIGYHGGVSSGEMFVPLIVIRE